MLSLKFPNNLSKVLGIYISKRFASNEVRVRFAPSPTGYLHLGGLRTALYNHLFAKSHNGVSILRIEDTDLSRKVDSAPEQLIEDLTWCGITFDEGPYFQSKRVDIYQKYVKQLIEQGDAYYCFCSNVRLDLLRREALKAGEIPKYDNKCRRLSKKEIESKLMAEASPCVRFKLTKYNESFTDLVYGPVNYDVASEEGDPVILKKDGFPTYHLANVVDDHFMNISHVLRGVEWQMSTTKHLLLYRALKWEPPTYAHLPLLLNPDGTKLSKRTGDAQIRTLKDSGILPNAVINFIIRFGGGFDAEQKERDTKSFTIQELSEKFDIKRIKGSSCKISLDLLNNYNQLEIRRLLRSDQGSKTLVAKAQELVRKHFSESDHKNLQIDYEHVRSILEALKNRIKRLEELVSEDYQYLWLWKKMWAVKDESSVKPVEQLSMTVKEFQGDWSLENIQHMLKSFTKRHSLKASNFMKVVRVILTGKEMGPSVAELMALLGKEEVEFRLMSAVEEVQKRNTCR